MPGSGDGIHLKIPLFFAYDVLHGQRTVTVPQFSLVWPRLLTSMQ